MTPLTLLTVGFCQCSRMLCFRCFQNNAPNIVAYMRKVTHPRGWLRCFHLFFASFQLDFCCLLFRARFLDYGYTSRAGAICFVEQEVTCTSSHNMIATIARIKNKHASSPFPLPSEFCWRTKGNSRVGRGLLCFPPLPYTVIIIIVFAYL